MGSKCPVCGHGVLYIESHAYYNFYECEDCYFRCNERDLPLITAAMELAKMEVKLSDVSDKSSWYADARDAAHRRVLEVFGGE